ncbi:phage baseplate assembly protein V [Endozoicomonas euniceicola]|uniref:Phage baseplate assembly protein V n=1 Tax=Endozoicomonas euniceicola TaxID=1234143 RepID=A0ABY6GNE9_9GAMM|nr:phage baseplate assembly protein V [Endozoicomonas euniceicola]UYM14257.1 phage baseplate assembly protein V [Endozoicomonas euniceicola]
MDVYRILEDLERRLSNLLRIGVIENKGGEPSDKVRVRIGELHTKPLPWLTHRAGNDKTWWKPEDGEQVLVLSPFGDLAQGVVLPSLYKEQFSAPYNDAGKHITEYADGARIEYDRNAHKLTAQLPGGATTELTSSGGITFTGDLLVNGNITATQDITDSTRSMQADRDIYNGHNHPGVASGPSTTGAVAQKQ